VSDTELICFCFNYSKLEFEKAIKEGREDLIIEDIKAKIKDPGCSCKTLNPSGKCCLPDIAKFIKTKSCC
tara:strand:- start:40211 stop:40420 length:210 start_codon:yes stop_codon:yes gene_type:complete